MIDGFLTQQFRRTSRNMLIGAAILLAAAALTAALSFRYLRNVMADPVRMDKDAVRKVKDPAKLDRYKVIVESDENIETGYEFTSRSSRSGRVTEHSVYRALRMDDQFLLAKVPAGDPTGEAIEVTGWLVAVPSDVQVEVVDKIVSDVPGIEFLPMMLDGTGDNFPAVLLSLLLVALTGLGVFALARWLRSRSFAAHPLAKDLARYGDPAQVLQQIEAEVPPDTKGNNVISPRWVMALGNYGGSIRRLDDIAWAYRHTLTQKRYGITVGKTESVKLHDRAGNQLSCVFAKDAAGADRFLGQVMERGPWIVAGYSTDLEARWKKSRADFLAAVDERKRQPSRPG